LRHRNPVVNFRPLGERNFAACCIIIFALTFSHRHIALASSRGLYFFNAQASLSALHNSAGLLRQKEGGF
jgi:hypothetical protein